MLNAGGQIMKRYYDRLRSEKPDVPAPGIVTLIKTAKIYGAKTRQVIEDL